ncbi:MAG TPA: glycosyltransferase family 4 protein [Ignavibacteria bacterium]
MKTILLISHSSAAVGGGEDDFFRLLKFLQGKFVIYSAFPDDARAAEFIPLSNKYLIIPNRPYPVNKFRFKQFLAYIYFTIKKLFVLIPFLRKNKKTINLCFVNSSVCFVEMRLLKFFKIPYVVSVKEKINPGLVRKYVHKLIDNSASKVIVISNFLYKLLKDTIKEKEIRVIRTSIDEDIYNKYKSDINVQKNKNKFIILNVGQIYGLKNQILLVEAINKLKNKESVLVKFIGFVADNKYKEKLLRKIDEYELNNVIEFHGAMSKKEIISEYINSDAVVITSKEEGMSLVLVEALYFEKPVISTKVGIIPEIIANGENGIIVDSQNPYSLSSAIEELMSDKILYDKIKENALKTFRANFNLQKALEEHLEIFNECLSVNK